MQIQSILNISVEPSALRKLCGITMKMFTCLTCFFFCLLGFFLLVFALHFWRALKYAAPKNIWHYVFANLITLPHEKRWNENEKLTPTQLDSASHSFTLFLCLSLDLEAPCSLSVWSLLACKLHWLPRCTFLSFFPTASLSFSFPLSLRFTTLFFAYSFDLLAFCLALCARHFFVFSTYFTQCKSPLFQHFFSVSVSVSVSLCCLLLACLSLSHCQPLFYISNTWRIYVPSFLSGIGGAEGVMAQGQRH